MIILIGLKKIIWHEKAFMKIFCYFWWKIYVMTILCPNISSMKTWFLTDFIITIYKIGTQKF